MLFLDIPFNECKVGIQLFCNQFGIIFIYFICPFSLLFPAICSLVKILLTKFLGGGKIGISLVVPYLIYQILYLPFVAFDNKIISLSSGGWLKLLVGIVGGDGYNTPISYYICLPCWFIICIIQLRLLFLFVKINNLSSVILIIFSLGFLILRKLNHWDFYFCIDSTIMAIPYFLLGFYMKHYLMIERMHNWKYRLVAIIACAVSVFIIMKYNGAAQMNVPSYGKVLLFNYMAGIAGTLMVFMASAWLSEVFDKREWVKLVSRNTLFIIFSHWLLLTILGKIIARIMKVEDGVFQLIIALSLSVIVLHLSKIWIDVWVDKFPIVFGKRKESIK